MIQQIPTFVIRMAKNKRENALICLEGIGKTRFPDFPKSHLKFLCEIPQFPKKPEYEENINKIWSIFLKAFKK